MVLAVLADDILTEEFLSNPMTGGTEIVWADSVRALKIIEADAYFDLQFEPDPERIAHIAALLPRPVIVGSVNQSTGTIGRDFIRLNAWPTMLKRNIAEVAAGNAQTLRTAAGLFESMGWKCSMVPDIPGMITPRVVAMIINEAWYTLGDGVSSKEEIDMAMKLGTSYPYGPFEWGEKIGLHRVVSLLNELSREEGRYMPAPALLEATRG